MKTANYTGTQTATGGNGKYPLSTETLDFIQEQIHLLEALAGIGGTNYILRLPGNGLDGVAVIYHDPKTDTTARKGESELLYIAAAPAYSAAMKFLTVKTTAETVTADGEKYLEARVLRTAQFSAKAVAGAENYELKNFANLVNSKEFTPFPTNAALASQVRNLPQTVLNYLKDILAEKLTAKTQKGVTREQADNLKTACLLSCVDSYAFFGMSDYTLIVTEQGNDMVRQELIQGQDQHYVRTCVGGTWGEWVQQVETTMHLDVKIVGSTVYLRHGALPDDCDIVLLRKKKRSAWRTGGERRQPKRQYVHFKGIKLSKGTPGKWYVPKCVEVADRQCAGDLIGKEMPTLCASLFYVGDDGIGRVQGVRKNLILKSTHNKKGAAHRAFAPVGVQIARIKPNGGKDGGGEIVRMKYRISQQGHRDPISGKMAYTWRRTFSQD